MLDGTGRVRGWERRAQIRDSEKTLTWVNSIALNLYRTQRRRDRKREEIREFPIPPRVSLVAINVHHLLDQCRHTDRELLEKRYFFGYEIEDLAREQNCSQTAVRVRLMRARRILRQLFEEDPVVTPWRNAAWHYRYPAAEKQPGRRSVSTPADLGLSWGLGALAAWR
ncbi:MAG: hypothetical protein LAP85_03070 [Acidobacteriia bacterium]|nr:hypothetical protein [Terriglobia bacterium]